GDAAHVMSPFGARGLNSGAADAENLAWKLAVRLRGEAPDALVETYDRERRAAALENLAVTDRTMRFMVPHGVGRRAARNAILRGSLRVPALRRLVNSGRLAEPFSYAGSPIVARGAGDVGGVAPDFACERLGAARERVTRLRELVGGDFLVLLAGPRDAPRAAAAAVRASRLAYPTRVRVAAVGPDRPLRDVAVVRADPDGMAPYEAAGPRAWLIRPDGHIAASLAIDEPADVDALPELVAMAIGAGRVAAAAPSRARRARQSARHAPVGRAGGD
ncbi:MAG TPA: FAD-dependent monooxygenase, partial [Candidatus Limnocylindria bacterium]|nr:FAD-dependent monooxygenase [Candidatus Limnocylindria bacterium]